MSRPISFAILIALLAVTLAIPASAQDQSPGPPTPDSPPDGSVVWPSGDELRRELQDIGFTFRVEHDSGDWLGWAPRASIVEAPAVALGGAGSEDAAVRFGFELLQTDSLGADVDAALTALMEVAARLPLAPARADRMRRFVVADLLAKAPLALEPCYASIAEDGAVLIRDRPGDRGRDDRTGQLLEPPGHRRRVRSSTPVRRSRPRPMGQHPANRHPSGSPSWPLESRRCSIRSRPSSRARW